MVIVLAPLSSSVLAYLSSLLRMKNEVWKNVHYLHGMCWLHWFFICQTAYAGFWLIWRPLELKVIDQINSNIIPHRPCYHCSLLTLYSNCLFQLSGWHHENYLQYIKKSMKLKLTLTFFSKIWLELCYIFARKKTEFGTLALTELISIQLALLSK